MTRIIDSHCHIYPDKIALKAVSAVDRFYDGLPREHYDGTTATLLREGKKAGVTQFVVHSVATTPAQVPSINRFIAKAQQDADGAFIGLAALHPDSPTLRNDLEEALALGLKGVKVHPDFQRFEVDGEKARALYALCVEYGIPVLVHTGDFRYDYSNPERTARVLRDFPDLKMIGAHFGGWSVWDRALEHLTGFENLYVDTSSSFYWLGGEKALALIRAFGADRVLYGTDYPMWPQGEDLAFLSRLPLTEEEREKILWKNCARLYQHFFDDTEDPAHV